MAEFCFTYSNFKKRSRSFVAVCTATGVLGGYFYAPEQTQHLTARETLNIVATSENLPRSRKNWRCRQGDGRGNFLYFPLLYSRVAEGELLNSDVTSEITEQL